jgi:hypothetical protein
VQSVNPLDPLLQALVQDKLFSASVQTGQLHAAAAAAVKAFRYMGGHQPTDSRRPMDRRNGNSIARYCHSSPGVVLGPAVRSMKQEVLQIEDAIPWTLVRRTWRNMRATWRRQVKQTELVADFAARLKELKLSLLTDDATFIGCGTAWKNQLESCVQGRGSAALLASVWDEMKNTIRSWLASPGNAANPATARAAGAVKGASTKKFDAVPPGPESSSRAIKSLQAAIRNGGNDILLQAPLEAIVGNDTSSLHTVRQAVELERRIVAARLAAARSGDEDNHHSVSFFGKISAPWGDSDFDSGADTEKDNDSSMTDLDSDFDP